MRPVDSLGKLIVSVVTLGIFAIFTWWVLKYGVPDPVRDIVLQLSGALIGWTTIVIGYWVGSSAGSASKDAALQQQLPKEPPKS